MAHTAPSTTSHVFLSVVLAEQLPPCPFEVALIYSLMS
jgi:hypothetical protein